MNESSAEVLATVSQDDAHVVVTETTSKSLTCTGGSISCSQSEKNCTL